MVLGLFLQRAHKKRKRLLGKKLITFTKKTYWLADIFFELLMRKKTIYTPFYIRTRKTGTEAACSLEETPEVFCKSHLRPATLFKKDSDAGVFL